MRLSSKKLSPALKNQLAKTLIQTFSDFKNTSEIEVFLKDFFTDSELEAFSKRLAISYWLKKGRSYENIKTNLKVSSATIASVQESLGKPGIKLALKKIEAEEWANKWEEKIRKIIK